MADDLLKASERQEDDHLEDLAEYVMECFDRSKRHRDSIGMTETLQDCLRRFRGKYTTEELEKFGGISNYRGLTGMLVRSAFSWLKDAYFNAQDKPWTLEPTPEPELPESMQSELNDAINSQLTIAFSESGQVGMLSSQKRDLLQMLRNTASQMALDFAMESSKGMSKVIEDQLLEANFRDVLSEHLLDICIYPYAVLKGPVVRRKMIPVWKNNKYSFKVEPRYYIDRVDPKNFYPSPDSTNTQDGEFLIELMSLSRARLNEAKKMKDFYEDAINLVIDEADHQYSRQAQLQVTDNVDTNLDGVARNNTALKGSMYDVYEFNGRIPGETLLEFLEMHDRIDDARDDFGSEVQTTWGSIDPYEDYESTVWVCNGVVIFARLNSAKPIPYRGYYVTSAYKIPGSIYGECIPLVIADLQDELNVAARSRVYNMGMSAGPIAEADTSRFADNDAPERIEPWTVYPVTTNTAQNNNSAPAIRFQSIPNVSNELTAVMEETWEKAHRISGIPPYMYGDGQGAAPTLGAFSLQYAGATKGIKTIISNIDNDIVEKLIQQMYYYNMYYHEDDAIKADARVNVRGAAGLIAQEQRQARPLELLQALGPILAQMQPETALALANETLSESGYDPSKLGGKIGNADKEASNRLIGNSNPPQPDGRSGNVEQQLAGGQIPAQQSGPA